MKNIKLIACDIDGVLLEDTFSPILHTLAKKFGYPYTRELERNMFSRPREESLQYVLQNFKIDAKKIPVMVQTDLIKYYFEERNNYMSSNPNGLINGVPEFLERISKLGIEMICYGGLPENEIIDDFKPYLKYFTKYICTNDFRPGIKEITTEFHKLKYSEVLFIDDVNTVAEVAKDLNVPFIGIPADHDWGYQKDDMKRTGVKHIVQSVNDIDVELIMKIDREIEENQLWEK
ncbi:HAD family hydrolase [Enterococcus sp.]|uniref:HAD family hydrolase n=1 Tax=Enterococcus sp. TaxID=35783 RepID=UPI00290D45DF|nr:HAD hydrolase-like protein [Enterococcus sp.]MDU5337108.1 HAD hydrolase-like protein [Enterococcus sp.]